MKAARIMLLFTVIIWGWTFVATKICLGYMSPLELMGFRFLIALPILRLLGAFNKVSYSFGGHRMQLLLGSIILTAHFIIQITGIKYTSATNTGWIIAVTPLVVVALSFVFLREKIGKREIAGIVAATGGIMLLISRGHFGNFGWLSSTGDWLILASAHTWALYTIVTRDISRSYNPLAVTFAMLLLPAVTAFSVIILTSNPAHFLALPPRAIVSILFLGILGTALGHWFWQKGIAEIGASKAGLFLYLEPVATTALAVPYLHESFGTSTAVGGFLVLLGVWFAQRRSR